MSTASTASRPQRPESPQLRELAGIAQLAQLLGDHDLDSVFVLPASQGDFLPATFDRLTTARSGYGTTTSTVGHSSGSAEPATIQPPQNNT